MNKIIFSLCAFAFVLGATSCAAQAQKTSGNPEHNVIFYNVENLFDTLDHPLKNDEEFLPSSNLKWNTERYEAKMEALARVVLAASGGDPPALLGLAEVENAEVVAELGRRIGGGVGGRIDGRVEGRVEGRTSGRTIQYGIAHFESPDMRGIDCALLYQTGKGGFKVSETRAIPVHFDDDPEYKTRDILYVKGKFAKMKQPLHIFVNHWPSRRGGVEASEPRRVRAALVLRAVCDSLRGAEQDPKILIMGDFNDEPHNRSVVEILGAGSLDSGAQSSTSTLLNLMAAAAASGQGSYNYQGNWNMIDQFIASPRLAGLQPCRRCWVVRDAEPFSEEWMMYQSERFGDQPSRTYGGPNYYGGFSDHLPIRLKLVRLR